jgi:hypothetical protein
MPQNARARITEGKSAAPQAPDLSSLLLNKESASAVTGMGDGDRVGQAGGDLLQFDGFGGDAARGQFGGTARRNLCLGECVREHAKAKWRQKDVLNNQ